jgi:tRNA-binding protein
VFAPGNGRPREEAPVPMDPRDAFETLDLRVGRVTAVEPLAGARKPAFKLTVDFGPLGVRGSSAQLTGLYRAEDLVGRLVIAAVNLGVRRIAGFVSEVLVLGVPDEGGRVVLLSTEREVPAGGRVY